MANHSCYCCQQTIDYRPLSVFLGFSWNVAEERPVRIKVKLCRMCLKTLREHVESLRINHKAAHASE